MKSTESLDVTGKLAELSSATGETAMPGDTSRIENKRRRLVRGAVAFAPLVLTLRSGALAAASCTGAKALATVNPSGQITLTTNPTIHIAERDVCVSINDTDICATTGVPPKISGGSNRGTVQSVGGSRNFTCGNGTSGKIAILSSASAGSLGI